MTNEVRKKLTDKDRHEKVLRTTFVGPHPRQKVYAYVPRLLIALTEEIQFAKDEGRIAQAAHLSYRLGTLKLGIDDGEGAAVAFQDAVDCINDIHPKHRFFYRTLREFYRLWKIVALDARPGLLRHADGHDWQKMMQSGVAWDAFVEKHPPASTWQLLKQVEVIMEQMEVLSGQPVNDPVGLTSLEVCLLLERFGIPRTWYGPALFERLARIKIEMEENDGRSVDGGCSICSGVAASCLILDRRQTDADALLQWLRERHTDRFCHREIDMFADAGPGEHSVHYAAAVLQAFVDHGSAMNDFYVRKALEIFFEESNLEKGRFPASWTQFRNVTTYDFATYVFPTFARYLLAQLELDADQAKILTHTLESLALEIKADSIVAQLPGDQRGRIYGARENVGSFALGVLIGLPDEVEGILAFNLKRLSRYAESARTDAQRHRTIDSSIDRARKMIDGWLLQFECALYLRENGLPIPEVVTRWLGVGADAPVQESRQ